MRNYILLLLIAALLNSCDTEVKTVFDPKTDFSQYKTFCWMNGCEFSIEGPTFVNDSVLRENIKNAVINELKSKGLVLDSNNPDLLVAFVITMKDEQAIVYHRPDENAYRVQIERNEEVVNYLKGTMVIGIVDKKNSSMVWESQASRYMELNPDLSEKNIAKGIHLVLKDFPPKE